jgi:hypothetical protein
MVSVATALRVKITLNVVKTWPISGGLPCGLELWRADLKPRMALTKPPQMDHYPVGLELNHCYKSRIVMYVEPVSEIYRGCKGRPQE